MGNRYSLPFGFGNAVSALLAGAAKYLPNNGFIQAPYAPDAPSMQIATITFGSAPADNSTLIIPDSNNGLVPFQFTYHYSGSPGPGNIPLVAGGGTAAQAATATQVALAAQLVTWTADNSVVNRVTLTSKVPGRNVVLTGTQVTGIYAYVASVANRVIAGAVGKIKAQLGYVNP